LPSIFSVGITEIDDFQVILERMITPEQQPILHYWRTHPEAGGWSTEKIVELTIEVGQTMVSALEAVIANHLESNIALVLEGDYLIPSLATQMLFAGIPNQGRVQAVFLYEDDAAQLRENFLRREPVGCMGGSQTIGTDRAASSSVVGGFRADVGGDCYII